MTWWRSEMRHGSWRVAAIALVGLAVGSASNAGAAVVLSDGFGDGDRNNDGTLENTPDAVADAGTPWYEARATGSLDLFIAKDANDASAANGVELGGGNALDVVVAAGTSARSVGANFAPQTLANTGDKLVLTFDARIVGAIPTSDLLFRYGLLNSNGTRIGTEPNINAVTDDDFGYGVHQDTGPGDADDTLSLRGDLAGGGPMGGSSQSFGATSDDPVFLLDDNDAHHFVYTIERAGDDLRFTLAFDTFTYEGETNAAGGIAPLTFTFDEVIFGTQMDINYRIDNVSVAFVPVPEPAAAGAALVLVGGALLGRPRRRRAHQ
jgi:hypothetical protein